MKNIKILFLFSIFYFLFSASSALAFESTSATFEMHGAALGSISGSSSSPSFSQQSAGGQNTPGIISNVKQIASGILYWLFGWYTPRYDQIHYRWRNDDGSETTATWATNEDSPLIGFQKNTIIRLRFEIANKGWARGSAPQFQLEYAQNFDCSSGTYVAIPTSGNSQHWKMADSAYLTDGAATTNVANGLTDENAAFTAGQVKDTGNTAGAITLNFDNFTEMEFSIIPTNKALSAQLYCFRLTDNGSTANMAYSQYARAIISGYAAVGSVISSTYDTGLANGAAYNSLVWQGALNGGRVMLQLGTSDADSGWTYYGPDCTADTWYEAPPDTSIEIGCPVLNNNKRYFRYKAQLCSSSDCASPSDSTPQVDDISIDWSP